MTIDVARFRAEMKEVSALYGENINPPGTTDERRATYPVVMSVALLAIYSKLCDIEKLLEDDDD